jgi:hypothetical protein
MLKNRHGQRNGDSARLFLTRAAIREIVVHAHSQPNPTPLPTLIRSESTVSGHRNLYCFHYDACLDVAVKLDWDSWSCEKCPLFHVQEAPRAFAGNFANDRRGQQH